LLQEYKNYSVGTKKGKAAVRRFLLDNSDNLAVQDNIKHHQDSLIRSRASLRRKLNKRACDGTTGDESIAKDDDGVVVDVASHDDDGGSKHDEGDSGDVGTAKGQVDIDVANPGSLKINQLVVGCSAGDDSTEYVGDPVAKLRADNPSGPLYVSLIS
jgi:hypothetical protein